MKYYKIFIYFFLFSIAFADLKDELKKEILLYCGFENSVEVYLPQRNIFINSDFRRNTHAYTYDFKIFKENEPRYVEGKIGKGIFLESGWYGDFKRGTKNLLPLNSSKTDNFKDGFEIIGNAKFKIYDKGGIVSKKLVKIICEGENSGIETKKFEIPYIMRYIFSVYLKGETGGEKVKLIIEDETNQVIEEKEFVIKNEWDRYYLILPYDEMKKKYKEKELKEPAIVKIKILSEEESSFYFDALMFEQTGVFYSNRYSPSTWIEGENFRGSEILNIPFEDYTFNLNEGSITFWMKYGDENVGRTFFNIAYGWDKVLSLTEYPKNILNFYAFGSSYTEKLPEANVWHFVVISWKDKKFSLYIDGVKKCELTAKEEIISEVFNKHLFILPGNSESGAPFGAKTHINGIIDELIIFNKSLEKDEIEFLIKLEKQILDKPEIIVKYEYPFNVFPRKNEPSNIKFSVKNLTKENLNLDIKIKEPELKLLKEPVNLKPSEFKEISFVIPAYLLEPGKYEIIFEMKGKEKNYISNFPVKIGLWRNENKLPVLAWNAGEKDLNEMKLMKEIGVNVVPFSINSYKTYNWANEIGVSLFSHMGCRPDFRKDHIEDRILQNDGEYDGPNPLSEYVIESTKNKAKKWVEKIKDYECLKYIIINTEWQLPMDFGENFTKLTLEKFGIDLNRWKTDKSKAWRYLNPLNRLAPLLLKENELPENWIVKKDDNFYNFHFWYHEGNTNEIAVNKICVEEIKKERNDIKTIIEPILRYPPKKKYDEKIDIAEEWFYYPDPKSAVWVQENLTALVRNKKVKISGMPQFLFKPGWSAPYASTTPPDMFKEASLLCISRPLDMMTYWGWHLVLEKGKLLSYEEIEEKFKDKKWDEALKIGMQLGEGGGLFIPETKDAFKDISLNYFLPYGELFRNWENYPRKIAVLNSFASWIYGDVRWPGPGFLGNALFSSGIPFDVLWDEDFLENKNILDKYEIFIMPQTYAITSSIYEALKKFIEKGGIVIVDDVFKVKNIENTVIFKQDEFEKAKNFIRENVKLPVKIKGEDILMNILLSGSGKYIFIVNDKREYGKYFGKWEKVKEKGVENKVVLCVDKNFGEFLYDLNEKKLITGKENGNTVEYEIELKPADGKIIYVSDEKFREVEIKVGKDKINKGEIQNLNILLKGEKNLMKGSIPVKIEIIKGNGELLDLSDFYLCKEGKFDLSFYLPLNTFSGEWKVKVKELLTGKEKVISFFVK